MGVLIDASILIDAERGRLDLAARVAELPDEEAFLSVSTASELLHGVHRAAQTAQRTRRAAFVEALLQRLLVRDVDLATARAPARTWADLAAAGRRIGPHDLWLAATCIAHGLTLITANEREFAWLFDHNGIETLLEPPVKTFLLAIRRVGDAPVYLSPPDLLRHLNSLGWIPEEQHADLPSEALEPPTEADAISLDRVLARFQPSGPDAQLTRADTLKEYASEIFAAIQAHVAERTARHGALNEDQPLG